MLKVIGTALLTAFVTSMFWIWFYNFVPGAASNGQVASSGDKVTVNPSGSATVTIAEGVEVGPAGLAIPVVGLKADQLVDTYTQARAGGARRHDAIDIMAAEGTPVVSAADGTVEKIFYSAQGGLTVYVRSPDRRWSYYYAHLQSYAPGLKQGQQVKRGQLLGRVGHTGNANPAGPHLHFAINQMQADERWWSGAPVNPYPLLAGKKVSG
jgi:murein DD-endopeptidase MepM/ murein hydrolase activator NlpD